MVGARKRTHSPNTAERVDAPSSCHVGRKYLHMRSVRKSTAVLMARLDCPGGGAGCRPLLRAASPVAASPRSPRPGRSCDDACAAARLLCSRRTPWKVTGRAPVQLPPTDSSAIVSASLHGGMAWLWGVGLVARGCAHCSKLSRTMHVSHGDTQRYTYPSLGWELHVKRLSRQSPLNLLRTRHAPGGGVTTRPPSGGAAARACRTFTTWCGATA